MTYRFYDYDRLSDGKPRPLHIAQSLAVTQAPHSLEAPQQETCRQDDAEITHLVTCPYYAVYRVQLHGHWETSWEQPFVNVSVTGGSGTLDGQPVKLGDHLLIPAGYGHMVLEGNLELIYSHLCLVPN